MPNNDEGETAVTRMIFVNLPVRDVEASVAFYQALGFTRNEQFSQVGQAASMVWSDAITLMLLSHDFYSGFLPAGKTIADTHSTSAALLCLSFDSRAAVDAVTDAAAAAGGKSDVRAAQDMGFMYSRAFEDLDGHTFEPMYMDVEAALSAMQSQAA
jgi:predicted lactoylglutathione lyase